MGLGYGNMFPPSRQLVNYDYFDISDGVGYDVFYGAMALSGSYILSTTSNLYSELPHTSSGAKISNTTYTKPLPDLDFEVTFNRPKNIKGKILCNIPIGITNMEGNPYNFFYHCDVSAHYYNGTTETMMASGASIRYAHANLAAAGTGSNMALVYLDVPLTHFKKGETLRFRISAWCISPEQDAADVEFGIGHDPIGRADYSYQLSGSGINLQNHGIVISDPPSSTQMSFHVPFVINV